MELENILGLLLMYSLGVAIFHMVVCGVIDLVGRKRRR